MIIDCGNSEYQDTARRDELKAKGLLYVCSGVSDGEEDARYGSSVIPGGNPEAWKHIQQIFQTIFAKADNEPCCGWVGEGGAVYFVKMVHNGMWKKVKCNQNVKWNMVKCNRYVKHSI